MSKKIETQKEKIIQVGKIYQHYKGNLYKVIAIAHDSENPKLLRVIYQALYDIPGFETNSIWSRSYKMFAKNIIINKNEVERFKEII